VETKALKGSYNSNPFGFYRKWVVTKNFGESLSAEIRNCYLVDEMSQMKQAMNQMMVQNNLLYQILQKQQTLAAASAPTAAAGPEQGSAAENDPEQGSSTGVRGKQLLRGRGRAKNRNLRPNPPQRQSLQEPEDDVNSERSFASAVSALELPNASMNPQQQLLRANQNQQQQLQTTTEIVFLKSLQVDINTEPLDQFKSDNSADECVAGNQS
jgi:hypothetical protein